MNLTSVGFAAFVAVVFAGYHLAGTRGKNLLLLASSYVFYLSWSWQFPLVLLAVTASNFAIARRIQGSPRRARFWLAAGVGVDLAALAAFKYAGFFVADLVAALHRWGAISPDRTLEVLLPVGLSFYALQGVSYLVDVRRRQMTASADFVAFATYMAYFPKLTAGPIERARTFLPRLAFPRRVDDETLAEAGALILIGLVRKVVIADPMMRAVPDVAFHDPSGFSSPELAGWLVAWAFGLYNGFAGYTSIVRGVSLLFGIELSPNFASPFFSRSFGELWSRWHLSLSHWFRDYVFYPLARAIARRRRDPRDALGLAAPPLVTMLASGLWHGPGWNVLAWGGLMGAFLAVERGFAARRPARAVDELPIWRQCVRAGAVLILALLSVAPFRMDVPDAARYLEGLFALRDLTLPDTRVFVLILPGLALDWIHFRTNDELAFRRLPALARSGLVAAAVLAVLLFSREALPEPFVYQGF